MAKFGTIRLAGILSVLCAAVTFAAWQLNEYAVEKLVKDTATQSSLDAASYFIEKMPRIDAVLAGSTVPPEDVAFISTVLQAKAVDVFKLYDARGITVFDSQLDKQVIGGTSSLGQQNPVALAVLSGGEPFVKLEDEVEQHDDKLLSETFIPFHRDGKLAGVAEVRTDQTSAAQLFRHSFSKFAALVAVLVCMSFSFPAFAFFRRTGQKLEADEHIKFMNTHDVLTRLPNREQFAKLLTDAMQARSGGNELVAVHYIDLDWFKDVNEKHGHATGNELLQAVAARLSGAVRQSDLVARLGADEFVVAQCGMPDHVELATVTKRIVEVFGGPFRMPGKEINVSASIGTAVGLCAQARAETLIDNADTAAFVIKSRGRNGHCYFESKFTEERREHIHIETLVRNACVEDRFELHYQPLYHFQTGQLKGFEALLRLRNEDGNFISPAKFIPIAENIGLIDQIGSWVLRHASLTAAGWPNGIQVSVNLSAVQFERRSVVAATRSALAASGLESSRLLLEITESTLLSDTTVVIAQLQELKALGTKIVMDDFGTGYSSLGYMLKFPFDHLKIDRSFVQAMSQGNSNAHTVIETIVTLGHSLKMDVTAEGVETDEQAATLRALKCDYVQGFRYGRPVPATEVAAIILRTSGAAANSGTQQQVDAAAEAVA